MWYLGTVQMPTGQSTNGNVMTPEEFMRTIYLGDRTCKAITMDGWRHELRIQIDCISRVRAEQWDYYTDEDLPDGYLVFEKVESVVFEPAGHIPNDWIALAWISTDQYLGNAAR